MPTNCFKFVGRYIYFCDNSSFENNREDRLFRIGSVLKRIMGQLQKIWNAGINLSIDEATVLYKGHAIPFVMYNPKKTIKHGIKVSSLYVLYLYSLYIFIIIINNITVQIFTLCCAVTGVVITFDVYTGDTYAHKNTSDMVKNLVIMSGLSGNTCYKLFMDNYYTTLKVI